MPFSKIRDEIIKEGHETELTRELVDVSFRLKDIDVISMIRLVDSDEFDYFNNIVSLAKAGIDIQIGPYIISHYHDMFIQLNDILNEVEKDPESRRLVIGFDKLHCFQSIQFLFRFDKIYTIVTMRSCNLVDNFMADVFLSLYCSREVARKVNAQLVDFTMNIGSLHIFKKDIVENVV